MLKTCDNCKKEYTPRYSNVPRKHFFCSKPCVYAFGRITLICVKCNKPFECRKKWLKQGRRYCSSKCANQSLPNNSVIKPCEQCGKEFKAKPSEPKRFCSQQCFGDSKAIFKTCDQCGKQFRGFKSKINKQRFCDKDCRKSYFEANHQIIINCESCGNDFVDYASRGEGRKNCSLECRIKHANGKNNCKECGKEFSYKKSEHGGIYCSNLCYHESRSKFYYGANGGWFTEAQFEEKLKLFGNKRYLCKTDLADHIIHREHRIPKSRGGRNWISNIAPACSDCNLKKATMTEKEFREKLKFSAPL